MQFAKRHILKAILVVVLLLVFVVPSFANTTNGSFETGDFTGWSSLIFGSANLYVGTAPAGGCDSILPSNGVTDGIYAAYFDMSGPNTTALWQDVVVPTNGVVSLAITYENNAGAWFWTGALDYTGGSNQHLRVDVMDPAATAFSVAAGDIYLTVMETGAASPLTVDKVTYSADISAWAGQTVRIRIAKVDNLGCFPVAVDNVQVYGTSSLNVPHVDDIRINAGSNVPAYDGPAGSQAKLANGQEIFLPQDYDGNGFDTYIVTDTAVVDGVTWYSIFLGNENFVWVNGSQVIPQ